MAAIPLVLVSLLASFGVVGCEDGSVVEFVEVDVAPPAPQGVYTVRGDNRVTIYWLPVEANDFDYYRIYRGDDSSNGSLFELAGETVTEIFVDDPATSLLPGVTNGTRYYYAVTAVDLAGNESLQSFEYGGATPRVDGFGITLFTNDVDPALSGFDLSSGGRTNFASVLTDFWIDRDNNGILYINTDTIGSPSVGFGDIQDLGYTESLDDIGWAPTPPTLDGWSALQFYEVLDGHTYVIWTQDDRYAKVRVRSQTATSVLIDYAYQSGAAWGGGGEPEFAPLTDGGTDNSSKYNRPISEYRTDSSQKAKEIQSVSLEYDLE